MDKIEHTLNQDQLPFLKELPVKYIENVPVQNGFRALLDHPKEEKSIFTEVPVEKNKNIYQHKLAISTQSLNY